VRRPAPLELKVVGAAAAPDRRSHNQEAVGTSDNSSGEISSGNSVLGTGSTSLRHPRRATGSLLLELAAELGCPLRAPSPPEVGRGV
jgi:hypothetical protein